MAEWMSVIDEQHTKYGACYQLVKWHPEVIAGYEKPNGYIVQRFSRKSEPSNLIVDDTSYYEAWKIENGICVDTENQKYDDQFAVGHPLFPSEVLPESIKTKGIFCFEGEIYWVDAHSDLYNVVAEWPTDEVQQSGGLHSTFNSEIFKCRTPDYIRPKFKHCWNLESDESVYLVVKELLFRMCPDNRSTRDKSIFMETIEEVLPSELKNIKEKIILEWENQ